MDRNRKIVRTSVLGIVVNLALAAFKAAVGLLANSIAVLLDAVNNLSDALASMITIVGTKLSGRRPDKKHPYGYGRVEYLTSVVIAAIVLLAGATSLRESAEKAIHPEETSYTVVSIVILAAAVAVKFLLGRYTKRMGAEVDSGALIAAGTDAFFDSILSLATLLAAIAGLLWGWKLEGVLGVAISLLIIKAGFDMLREMLDNIIGARIDSELSRSVKREIAQFPEVLGVFDLSVHNYGPTELIGSAHIEVPDEMTALEIHHLTRAISAQVYRKLGMVLTLGIYAAGDSSELLPERRDKATAYAVRDKATAYAVQRKEILQLHGFYYDEAKKQVYFDMIVDFEADADAVRAEMISELQKSFPDHRFDIVLDSDYSD